MQNEIKVFKGVSRKDGFLDLMYIYIDLIRKSGFDVKKIDEISIKNNINYLKSGIVSELRVYGDFISKGVAEEIAIAREFKIPVVYKTKLN